MASSFVPELAVAPMVDVTTRHFRKLARIMSNYSAIYTEMVVSKALVSKPTHNRPREDKPHTVLPFRGENEHNELLPKGLAGSSILQIGGSDPQEMAESVIYAKSLGWKRFNINCGCPSPKLIVTEKGKARNEKAVSFGVSLMDEPTRVKEFSKSMVEALNAAGLGDEGNRFSLSLKSRIGLDDNDSYENLHNFISTVSEAGINHFIIHSRKAILGLSPKDNRKIPEVNYDFAYKLIKDLPHLTFTINGAIDSYAKIDQHFDRGANGVMVGRMVMDNPWSFLGPLDHYLSLKMPHIFPSSNVCCLTPKQVVHEYLEYVYEEISSDPCHTKLILTPLFQLLHPFNNKATEAIRNATRGPITRVDIRRDIDRYLKDFPDSILERSPLSILRNAGILPPS